MNKILKIGHRGASGYEPENTLISFKKALEMKVDGIELDVHLSIDGHLMVMHDETIDRTTNGKGFVNQLTLTELKSYRIKNTIEIPTLEEVFNLVNKKCFINIELKNHETAEKVVHLIEKYIAEKDWKYADFIVSSFDWNAIQQVRFLNDKIPIAVLTEDDLDLAFSFVKFIKADAINPDFQLLTHEKVIEIQKKGIKIFPWTVNNIEDIERTKKMGVDGIISDFVDRI